MTRYLGELTHQEIENALRTDGLGLDIFGFRCLVTSNTGLLTSPLHFLYPRYPAEIIPNGFFDFHIALNESRHFLGKKTVHFLWEDKSPFPDLPLDQAHALFEWGLNWCIATASGSDIVIHAAVVERDGMALVLPGEPGSGKSTFCADLVFKGWRLLSDELTIIDPKTGLVRPFPRPISLKNSSIDIVAERHPAAPMSGRITDTRKGDIAYIRPPDSAVDSAEAVKISRVIFPKYIAQAELELTPLTKAFGFSRLLENTFNLDLLNKQGFAQYADSISDTDFFDLSYSDLDQVHRCLAELCK